MKMRITGGTAKGRRIVSGRSFSKKYGTGELRPTSSKVREAIFDILRDRIRGSLFVDLYAGTGAVGIEALSRGAAKAVFVESSKARADMIDSMLARHGLDGHSIVVNSMAQDFIRGGLESGRPCDIVFLDPPYVSNEIEGALHLLGEADLLSAGGILIAEHSSRLALPDGAGALRKAKDYRYGDSALTTYRMEES